MKIIKKILEIAEYHLTEIAQKITEKFLINNCVLALFYPDTGRGFNAFYLSRKGSMDWIDFQENGCAAIYEAMSQFDAEYEEDPETDRGLIFSKKDQKFSIAFYGDSEPIHNQEILDLIKEEILKVLNEE